MSELNSLQRARLAAIKAKVAQAGPPPGLPEPVGCGRDVDASHMASIPAPDHPQFRGKMPSWVKDIRPHQWQAVEEIQDAYKRGAKVVFLDAPTGAGKSLLGFITHVLNGGNSLYVCSSKTLQDQFVTDFNAAVLKGRSNYETLEGPSEVTAADCTKSNESACVWCPRREWACPYNQAKQAAKNHDIAVLNTSYLLAEANNHSTIFGSNPETGPNRDLVIVDECDVLEAEMMNYVEVAVGEYRLKQLKVDAKPRFVTKPESWAEWLTTQVIPAAKREAGKINTRTTDIRKIRTRLALHRLVRGLNLVVPGLTSGNWVFDGYNSNRAVFKPVRVNEFGANFLWRHAEKFLCMSATIVSAEELADSLGLDGAYEVVRVPMTFPVENRRVHIAPVANMTAKHAEVEWPKMAKAIDRLLDKHPTERVLIHTVSYKLAGYLMDELRHQGRSFFTYRTAAEREAALLNYRNTFAAVLIAPSMDRGVDLRDDDCRVVIVAKLPFPYLGDKQVNARIHSKGGNTWYAVQACRSLVQMTGRGVRSADDWCTSYVLDAQLTQNVWKQSRHLLPQWWVEALNWDFNARMLTKP